MLHPSNLVSRRPVILCDLGLDYNLWVEFVGNNEVWRLVEVSNSPSALSFTEADLGSDELCLNRRLEYVGPQARKRCHDALQTSAPEISRREALHTVRQDRPPIAGSRYRFSYLPCQVDRFCRWGQRAGLQ